MLDSNAGTSEKILSDWNNFHYILKETDGTFHSFHTRYQKQSGYLTVQTDNGIIKSSTLDLKDFGRPLGSHNDEPLNTLAKKVLDDLGVQY